MTDQELRLVELGRTQLQIMAADLLNFHHIVIPVDLSDKHCLQLGQAIHQNTVNEYARWEAANKAEQERRATMTPEERAYEDGYKAGSSGSDWC